MTSPEEQSSFFVIKWNERPMTLSLTEAGTSLHFIRDDSHPLLTWCSLADSHPEMVTTELVKRLYLCATCAWASSSRLPGDRLWNYTIRAQCAECLHWYWLVDPGVIQEHQVILTGAVCAGSTHTPARLLHIDDPTHSKVLP